MPGPLSEPEFKHWMDMVLKVVTEHRDEQRLTNTLLREILEEPADNPLVEAVSTFFGGGAGGEPRPRGGRKGPKRR